MDEAYLLSFEPAGAFNRTRLQHRTPKPEMTANKQEVEADSPSPPYSRSAPNIPSILFHMAETRNFRFLQLMPFCTTSSTIGKVYQPVVIDEWIYDASGIKDAALISHQQAGNLANRIDSSAKS